MKVYLLYSSLAILGLFILLVIYNYWPESKFPKGTSITKIVVEKSKRQMHVYNEGTLVKSYKISLGPNPSGDKAFEGDGKTPIGIYSIHDKNPNSSFYLNLGISYPNLQDREEAKLMGKDPGGNIKIHGLRNGVGFIGKLHRLSDWTEGCIAVTNSEMDELYEHVEIGTTIEIYEYHLKCRK